MNSLNALGGAAGGLVEGKQEALKMQSQERENAIKDYQIKKMADEDAMNNKIIPISSIWPNYKEMPETYKAIVDSIKSNGLGEGLMEGQIPGIRVREAREFLQLMALNEDTKKKVNEGTMTDLLNKHTVLSQKIDMGVDSDGKPFKPEVLDAMKKEIARVEKAYTGMKELMDYTKIKTEKMKQAAKMAEKKVIGVVEGIGPISQDKAGRYFGPDNQPYTGNPADIQLVGEAVRATPTHGSSSVVVTNTGTDNRTPDERNYEREQKDANFAKWRREREKEKKKPSTGFQMPTITGPKG